MYDNSDDYLVDIYDKRIDIGDEILISKTYGCHIFVLKVKYIKKDRIYFYDNDLKFKYIYYSRESILNLTKHIFNPKYQ